MPISYDGTNDCFSAVCAKVQKGMVISMKHFTDINSIFRRRGDAVAFINGSRKYPDIHGRSLFYQTPYGVIVRTEVINLPKGNPKGSLKGEGICASPVFAFHIHDGSRCAGNMEDLFADAGVHYNPNNCLHPYHSGDLPPLFGADGRALSVCLTDRFTVNEIIGKTVIIHSSPDDFTTQPSGNAGEKIACGIITATAR